MESRRYRHEDLFDYGCRVLERLDVPAAHAREVAGCLIKAELRGVDSHGLVRLPVYARRVQAGVVKARPDIRLHAVGYGGGPRRRRQRSRSRRRRTGDGGRAGAGAEPRDGFRRRPAQQSFRPGRLLRREGGERRAASAWRFPTRRPTWRRSEARPASSEPTPSRSAYPPARKPPLIFDASTSVVARGKIIVAAHTEAADSRRLGDRSRRVSRRPMPEQALAGAVLPFGGPKGSAISFIIDILCGVHDRRVVRART